MKIYQALLLIPLCLSLAGCITVYSDEYDNSTDWRDEQSRNRENISNLTLGLTQSEVLMRMGRPTFTEAFTNSNSLSYSLLFYRTQRKHGDGQTSKDETTVLVFENNKLIGWGNDALQQIR